jgi:trk system potassium uptake protein TrkH
MNIRIIFRSVGTLMLILSVCLAVCTAIAILYRGEDVFAFTAVALIALLLWGLSRFIKPQAGSVRAGEGLMIVGIGWGLIAVIGALPFILSGATGNFADALFETISGLSSTGSSVFPDIESLPKGIVFWRSFTQWLGGLGFLSLVLAILPSGRGAVNILNAETAGPSKDKFVSRINNEMKILYVIYFIITLLCVIFLLFGGMSLYDAFIHAFSTAGTGGFSSNNASINGYHSMYIEGVIMVFMLLSGVNLSLYYLLFRRNFKTILQNVELRFYLCAIAFFTLTMAISVRISGDYRNFFLALFDSAFQTVSMITTTGYTSADYNLWPVYSQLALILLAFIGGMAGSTAGGLKCARVVMLGKIARREMKHRIAPNTVSAVKLNGSAVEEKTLSGVTVYFMLYIAITVVTMFIIAVFDSSDINVVVSAPIASISNAGPGLGAIGGFGNYAGLSDVSKIALSLCMIIGRLEIFPVLLLFTAGRSAIRRAA